MPPKLQYNEATGLWEVHKYSHTTDEDGHLYWVTPFLDKDDATDYYNFLLTLTTQ